MLPQSVEPLDTPVRDMLLPRARLTLQPDMNYSIYLQLNQNKRGVDYRSCSMGENELCMNIEHVISSNLSF